MEWLAALRLSAIGLTAVVAFGYLLLLFRHWP
jgi:hypothetical protein